MTPPSLDVVISKLDGHTEQLERIYQAVEAQGTRITQIEIDSAAQAERVAAIGRDLNSVKAKGYMWDTSNTILSTLAAIRAFFGDL